MRNVRLIPIVLLATASLFVLKTAGILSGGGYTLGGLPGARAQSAAAVAAPAVSDSRPEVPSKAGRAPQPERTRSWAQEVLGFPEITGSVGGGKPAQIPGAEVSKAADQANSGGEPKPADKSKPPTPATQANVNGAPMPPENRFPVSTGERAVLERLQERRQELEARGRELEIREGLVKAAEMRLEARIGELKQIEAQVNAGLQKKDETEVARFKGLITMYENMKAKDAARIFDRLEPKILLDVAGQINPRRMSDILAQMSPEAAERVTVELASRASSGKPAAAELPKIEGRPRP